jgi:site-specific DNA recombinase
VAEFFDVGTSRSLPWARRPQASALLTAAQDPDRGFDAVVVGEFERAFAGGQAQVVIALLAEFGVQGWLPEARGPLDLARPEHQALLLMLGHQSEREVLRNRFRTTAAMAAQIKEQGRNLGGRPPYGYRLVDAGPHPKAMHAGWGRRQYRLEPDPVTAPTACWIFAQRLDGMSAASIARHSTTAASPPPACTIGNATDTAPRRCGRCARSPQSWPTRATPAGKYGTGSTPITAKLYPATAAQATGPVRVWNRRSDWVISDEPTHTALISDDDFLAVQQITALATPHDGRNHRYQLTGLLVCALCGRRLEGHGVNGRPGFRCRHGHSTARSADADRPRWVYWSQTRLVNQVLADTGDGLPDIADAGQLAAHLRARGALIVCGPDTVAIKQPELETSEPGADEQATRSQLTLPFPATRPRRPAPQLPQSAQGNSASDPGSTKPPSRSTERE